MNFFYNYPLKSLDHLFCSELIMRYSHIHYVGVNVGIINRKHAVASKTVDTLG